MSLELTVNYDDRSYDVGDAWGHVAARVDDLEGDWATLLDREAEDYRDPESCGYNYAFTKLPDGQEVELVTR
jgi:lactoylglutathione lyase